MRRLFEFFSFILCLSFVITCDENEFKSETGLCCELCPAGKHLKGCEQGSGTACLACPKDQFTTIPNNFTSCEKCTSVTCDGGRIVQPCTQTSNNQCVCPPTKYWNHHKLWCDNCKKCGPGEKEKSPCKTGKDAECEKCPEGTYKDSVNSCASCRHCHKGQVVVTECTIRTNTVCGRVPVIPVTSPHSQKANMPTLMPTTLTPEPSLGTTGSRYQKEKDDARKVLHSCEPRIFSDGVAWFLLGSVVLLVCIVVLLSWSQLKKFVSKRKTPTKDAGKAAQKVCIVSSMKSSKPIKENNVKFSTLPANVTEELASHLNAKQGKNWKYLAGLMGYSTSFTQNLELTPLEATQRLLQDWEHKSDATVFELYCLLQKLGRDDAIAVLVPFLTTPKCRGEVQV